MNYNLNDAIKRLYFKGKSYELLSLYFNTKDDPDVEACILSGREKYMPKLKWQRHHHQSA
jgi:predicted CopG family antitoxin